MDGNVYVYCRRWNDHHHIAHIVIEQCASRFTMHFLLQFFNILLSKTLTRYDCPIFSDLPMNMLEYKLKKPWKGERENKQLSSVERRLVVWKRMLSDTVSLQKSLSWCKIYYQATMDICHCFTKDDPLENSQNAPVNCWPSILDNLIFFVDARLPSWSRSVPCLSVELEKVVNVLDSETGVLRKDQEINREKRHIDCEVKVPSVGTPFA